jgi:hypothetical protein
MQNKIQEKDLDYKIKFKKRLKSQKKLEENKFNNIINFDK